VRAAATPSIAIESRSGGQVGDELTESRPFRRTEQRSRKRLKVQVEASPWSRPPPSRGGDGTGGT